MSADNCVAIYVVKKKKGKKGQTIYIVKYVQGEYDGFSQEEIQKFLEGSLYTMDYNKAVRIAHRIHDQLGYTEYGVIVCRTYENVYISTKKPSDTQQEILSQLPCLTNPSEFFARLEFWANKKKGNFNTSCPEDATFLKLLNLPELKSDREYWNKKFE